MYSSYKDWKSVIAEWFIRTLKNEIYKYMTPISKHVYSDELDDIANKYNNTYHRTTKMKLVQYNSGKSFNDKDPKFKIGENVTISKNENIFAKSNVLDWFKRFLWLQKLKTLCRGFTLVVTLKDK